MKLPERPPNWKTLLEKEPKKISEIFKDKALFQTVSGFNKRYLYWSELKYRVTDKNQTKYLWAFMKLLRSDKYEAISFKSIAMKYTLLSDLNRSLNQCDKSLAGNIGIQTKSLGLQKRYIVSSLMEEAIASSMIEGASTTRKVAKEMLRKKRKPVTESEKMIVNNYETMQYVLEQKEKTLTPEFLIEIQKRITKGTLEDPLDEGRYRNTDDVVVGDRLDPAVIAYVPPDYKKVPELIEEVCAFANSDSEDFLHPILKAVTLHFLIAYIHPFNDGNGRTARSIFYWYLISKGYWLFEYLSVSRIIVRSRKQYDLAYLYTEYDEMDLTYFFQYNLRCVTEALKELDAYIKKKQAEQDDTRKLISDHPELNLRQSMIVEEFLRNPTKVFTIKEISELYKVVNQTARTDLLLLEKKGFITKHVDGKTFVFTYK